MGLTLCYPVFGVPDIARQFAPCARRAGRLMSTPDGDIPERGIVEVEANKAEGKTRDAGEGDPHVKRERQHKCELTSHCDHHDVDSRGYQTTLSRGDRG